MGRQRDTPGLVDESGWAPDRDDRHRSSDSEYGSTWERDESRMGASMVTKAASVLAGRKMEQLKASPAANLAMFIMLPWVVFTVVMGPFALGYRHFHAAAWAILGLGLALSGALWLLGQRPSQAEVHLKSYWNYLSALCVVAAVLGALLGLYGYFRFVTVYHIYQASRFYLNVLPTQAPAEFQDAGMFTFSHDAYVDPTRSVGYRAALRRYCAAPILAHRATTSAPGVEPLANFWAVGLDCCHSRGLFECGPVWDASAHSGLRVLDASPLRVQERPKYMTAVREAASAYGLSAPDNAILVEWTKSPEDLPQVHWDDGVRFYTRAVGVYIAVVLALGLFAALYWDARRSRTPVL
mmetsp:Transcript_124247/g.362713  ORF Transcript_124247/g.362713 Transcript_124247/m.362713 type:complete len:353 (-) Transcript_124247:110-1168(-)